MHTHAERLTAIFKEEIYLKYTLFNGKYSNLNISYAKYLNLTNHPKFISYLENITPLKYFLNLIFPAALQKENQNDFCLH
jgi:hypothetical protein